MFPAGRESRILTDHGKDAHTGTTLPFWEIAQSRGLKLLISYASGHNLFRNLCVIDFNLSNISSSPVSFYNVTQKALSNPIYKRTFLRIKGMGYWVHGFSLVRKLYFICELLMTFVRWPWLLQKTHHTRNSTVKVLSLSLPARTLTLLIVFFLFLNASQVCFRMTCPKILFCVRVKIVSTPEGRPKGTPSATQLTMHTDRNTSEAGARKL